MGDRKRVGDRKRENKNSNNDYNNSQHIRALNMCQALFKYFTYKFLPSSKHLYEVDYYSSILQIEN